MDDPNRYALKCWYSWLYRDSRCAKTTAAAFHANAVSGRACTRSSGAMRCAGQRSVGKGQEIGMRVSSLLALSLLSLCNGGCFPPVALSTVETTGSSAPVVLDHFGRGRGIGFCLANYDDVTAATLRAAEGLSLEQKDKNVAKDRASFRFYDANNDRIDVIIVRRSVTMTSLQFDVGWFGPKALGRLMSQQIIAELHRSEAFLQNWTTDTGNK